MLKVVCWWLLGGENDQVWEDAMVEEVERRGWLWWMSQECSGMVGGGGLPMSRGRMPKMGVVAQPGRREAA